MAMKRKVEEFELCNMKECNLLGLICLLCSSISVNSHWLCLAISTLVGLWLIFNFLHSLLPLCGKSSSLVITLLAWPFVAPLSLCLLSIKCLVVTLHSYSLAFLCFSISVASLAWSHHHPWTCSLKFSSGLLAHKAFFCSWKIFMCPQECIVHNGTKYTEWCASGGHTIVITYT